MTNLVETTTSEEESNSKPIASKPAATKGLSLERLKAMQERMASKEHKPNEPGNAELEGFSFEDVMEIAEMAYAQMQHGRFRNAAIIADNLQQLMPEVWYFHALLGVIHLEAVLAGDKSEQFNLDAAESFLSAALTLNPSDLATYASRAEVLIYKGNLQGAIGDLQQVKALDPQCTSPHTARAHKLALELLRAIERLKSQKVASAP